MQISVSLPQGANEPPQPQVPPSLDLSPILNSRETSFLGGSRQSRNTAPPQQSISAFDVEGDEEPNGDEELDDNGEPIHNPRRPRSIPVPAVISPRKTHKRAIFIDWVRSISVYIVVIVHVFVSIQRVTEPEPMLRDKIEGSFRVVLQFGMPLFFYFSARSAALGSATMGRFIVSKLQRLLLPFVVGFLLIVIPTCYIGRKYRPCAAKDVDNFFVFYGNYFTSQIACNGFDWYWFLPTLFALSLLNQYYLMWIKARYSAMRGGGESSVESPALTAPVAVDVPPRATGRPDFTWRDDIPAGVYLIVLTAVLFGAGAAIKMPLGLLAVAIIPYYALFVLVQLSTYIKHFNLMYLFYLATPVPSIILGGMMSPAYREGGIFDSIFDQVLMVLFYNHFYIEGFIDEVFDADWKQWRDNSKVHAGVKPTALLSMIVFLAIGAPTTSNSGYIYAYPLYKSSWYLCGTYVLGTWLWIALWLRYSTTFYNEVLSEFQYTHVTTSSMLVYLVHWFFIDSLQVLFVVPYKLTLVQGFCIVFPGTLICCALLYALILWCGRLIQKLRSKKRRAYLKDGAA